ncbi:DMT family transporter [Sinirhodobacter ferrireducens]|uniref:DMT family transporter n=1 Tax=Paenirhodobacter ferrireducens TaxID=1215032 RepID=A0A443LTJ7_9RHOB|nr:DMT family transporter [Sinirhodobacter ferrireducens]RWR52494.1 DMT family transporter [Sinirhodobacter ferrireducens]
MSEATEGRARLGLEGIAALALPPLFWAGNFIVARAARGEVPPMALSCVRWGLALLCMLPFAWPYLKRDAAWYRENWKLVALVGIPGVTGFNTLVYVGLQYTTATNGMLLNSTIPVLILVLGALFWGRKMRALQAFGLLVSTFGVAVIILHGEWQRLVTLEFSRGDLIIFVAMICWALYTLGLTRIPASVNRLGLLAVHSAMTLVLLAPFLGLEIAAGRVPSFSGAGIAAMLYVGVVPSVLATLLYMRAVSIAGPARAGQFIHLLPVYGAVLSTLFLGEELHLYHAVGFGAILAGIVIAGRAGR